MKIGIITAMPQEFRAVSGSIGTAALTKIGPFRAGRFSFAGHEFLLVESGVGFVNAARAAEMLVDVFRPNLLISTGFCGSIALDLLVGDVVVADKIVIAHEGTLEEIPIRFSPIGKSFVARQVAEGKRVVGGMFVSTSTITSKRRLAAILPDHCSNPVVEMESGAISIIAVENNIPLLAIRAVSDAAAEELEFSLNEFCDSDMRRICLNKVLLTVLRKPLIIPQLVRLSRSSRMAAESITSTLSRLFSLL